MSRSEQPKKRSRVEVDLSKLALVSDTVLEKAEGLQPSVWDAFKDSFPVPGKMLKWKKDTEDGLTAQQASQLAGRMRILHPHLHFHSGVVATDSPPTVFVRRREEGWKPTAEKKKPSDPGDTSQPALQQGELLSDNTADTDDNGGADEEE